MLSQRAVKDKNPISNVCGNDCGNLLKINSLSYAFSPIFVYVISTLDKT